MNSVTFLLDNPKPVKIKRQFRGRPIAVWQGEANIQDISGWVDNPRLELEIQKFKRATTGRNPTQDEIFEIMLRVKDFDIEGLASDIRSNGIRNPLILAHNGKLLDGNRRFFATKRALLDTPKDDLAYKELSRVPVYVLDESATVEEEELVLWHENFHPDLKKEWSDYIKAKYITQAISEGLSHRDIKNKFGWSLSKIRETERIMNIISEYQAFAGAPEPEGLGKDDLDVEDFVNSNYQYFNEAQKSFYDPLLTNFDFKIDFFRWLSEDKFSSFQQVRIAYDGWTQPKLREILHSSRQDAAKVVKVNLDQAKVKADQKRDIKAILSEFMVEIEAMTTAELDSIGKEELEIIERILQRIHRFAEGMKS